MGVLIVLAAIALGVIYLREPLRAWRRYRGERLVICPETACAAAVSIDTGHAALTSLIEGRPEVRLERCSRWGERSRCDEPCRPDVEAAGVDGTVAAIVGRWYQSSKCRYCGRPIGGVDSSLHPPALANVDGITVAWRDIAAEQLPALFRNSAPVCGSCHLAETFRRTHADLVVDRPEHGTEKR
jgi:hypothetical protein